MIGYQLYVSFTSDFLSGLRLLADMWSPNFKLGRRGYGTLFGRKFLWQPVRKTRTQAQYPPLASRHKPMDERNSRFGMHNRAKPEHDNERGNIFGTAKHKKRPIWCYIIDLL